MTYLSIQHKMTDQVQLTVQINKSFFLPIQDMSLINDRTPLESLNLSVNYVAHWTYLQGLRELYQNFMDAIIEKYPDCPILYRTDPTPKLVKFTQAKRVGAQVQQVTQNFIEYDQTKKRLTMENQGAFGIQCMLMGCSEKGPEALGQFGEGMKVTMIVLLKSGINITIHSGDKIYYPTLKSWDHSPYFIEKYNKDVLYLKIQQRQYVNKTTVVVDGIDRPKFEEFLYLSLALLQQETFQTLSFGNSTLIITDDPKLKGKIFKKGVRLELHENKERKNFEDYSYNFEKIQVGRDRDCVNNSWDLYRLQSQLHFNVLKKSLDKTFRANHPQLNDKFSQHIEIMFKYMKQNNLQTHYMHEYTQHDKNVADLLYNHFLEVNQKEELYICYDSYLATINTEMRKYGLQASFYEYQQVGWETWHNLRHSNKYMPITTKIQKQIIDKSIRELTDPERPKMASIQQKIQVLIPEIANFTFKIKSFVGIICCKGVTNADKTVIYLNAAEINNTDKMTRQLLKMILA